MDICIDIALRAGSDLAVMSRLDALARCVVIDAHDAVRRGDVARLDECKVEHRAIRKARLALINGPAR
jgi:hypothetical protein